MRHVSFVEGYHTGVFEAGVKGQHAIRSEIGTRGKTPPIFDAIFVFVAAMK
jgi:hypothetical protein